MEIVQEPAESRAGHDDYYSLYWVKGGLRVPVAGSDQQPIPE